MERNTKWYKLDNAAKIIPSTAKGANTRVFRISCELKEEVDGGILQMALNEVIPDFSFFNCILKRGLFWYYMEDTNIMPKVEDDNLPACSPLYIPGRKNLLYRVNFYGRRINLEMFHVLADGTGAFMFFRRLIIKYLSIKHGIKVEDHGDDVSSVEEKNNDAFRQFYQRQRGLKQLKDLSKVKAYQLSGEKDENMEPHLVEGTVSARKFVEISKKYNTTVGVLATAVYIAAVIDGMSLRQMKRHVVVSVPVNLRQFFYSATARNFYGVIKIDFDPADYDGQIETIINSVKESFDRQLSEENIRQNMNSYSALEHNIAVKVAPLIVKDFTISRFDRATKKGITSSMSNLGRIKMPDEVSDYIDRFSAFMTAQSQQICVCSFGDKMVFGEVSPYKTHKVMLNFFRRLTSMGVSVELATNDYDNKL